MTTRSVGWRRDPGSRRVRTTAALVSAVVLVLGACTGDDDTAPPTTPPPTTTVVPTTTTSVPAVDPGAAYVLALVDPDVDVARSAELATGDAARYLEYRRTAADVLGGTYVALPGTTSHRICGDDGCAVVDRVVTDPGTGRVITFSIDGRPLAGRIAGSGLVADDDGVVAQTRTAYVTNAGELVVTVELGNTTDTDVELFGFAAVLRPSDGRGIETSGSFGTPRLAPGDSSTLVLVFGTDRLGGRIGLRGLRGDGIDVTLDVDVPDAADVPVDRPPLSPDAAG